MALPCEPQSDLRLLPMKVKISVILDVDMAAWEVNFPGDSVKDIKAYFAGLCEDHLKSIGCDRKTGEDAKRASAEDCLISLAG